MGALPRHAPYLKIYLCGTIVARMDRYQQFGLRGDADEQLRRAVRDGFKRAGLLPAQLAQAMEWYRDRGQHLGGDEAKLTESFAEFAASKAWPDAQRDAAVGVYGQVRDQGPAAVMSPAPSAEDDAATITRANELLRTDPKRYWADAELQEAAYEALERQTGAAAPAEACPQRCPRLGPRRRQRPRLRARRRLGARPPPRHSTAPPTRPGTTRSLP
jgi:hypothetical protein